MKIAILSLIPGRNYGGILQLYALKTVLERMGHEVHVLSRDRAYTSIYYFCHIPHFLLRLTRKIAGNYKSPIIAEYYEDKVNKVLYSSMLAFCQEHLNLRMISKFSDIQSEEFDAFVVGSDQVWRPQYFTKQYFVDISNAFLSFAKTWSIKRIAYAPSFGVDNWEYTSKQTRKCRQLLMRFDSVSVREVSGIGLCKKHLGREDVIQVCDPTMLLTKSDYEQIISSQTTTSASRLLVYCLDESEELNSLVMKISKEKQLEPFYINEKHKSSNVQAKPSIETWLMAFRDAEFVITDSFHACVFSLIFKREFIVFGNAKRGMSRFETLLREFGQTSRMLYKSSDYKKNGFPSLDNVDCVMDQLRSKSFEFLNNAVL